MGSSVLRSVWPRWLLMAGALISLVSCAGEVPTYQAQFYVFGTLVDITVVGAEPAKAEKAIAAINADFQRMNHEWHAWKPGPLTDLNKAIADGKSAPVIPSLIPIIKQSKVLYRKSDGLFNPAIGRLLNLWGFQADEPPNGPPPPRAVITDLVSKHPSMDDVEIRDGMLICDNPAVKLDFGAFAKGYAVDRAIDQLRAMGIKNAIVNAGGDLRAIGSHGDRPWKVGIRHPQGKGVLASLDVEGDESVFTSGNYERYREYEGVRYMHILDPRTGMPVQGVTSVTVIHDNGAVADAAATALVVAGPKEWHRIAKKMGIKYVMLVDETGTVYMNPRMAKRVVFTGPKPKVVLSAPL